MTEETREQRLQRAYDTPAVWDELHRRHGWSERLTPELIEDVDGGPLGVLSPCMRFVSVTDEQLLDALAAVDAGGAR